VGEIHAKGGAREATIEVVVIRANGEREELGVVSYWHKHFWKRWAFALRRKLKGATWRLS
jgi:hypothetical protein